MAEAVGIAETVGMAATAGLAETIAWIGEPGAPWPVGAGPEAPGRWARPAELCLPLDDRGLLLADGLFETLLVEEGQPRLLELHHQRWREGAALLAMAPPPDPGVVRRLVAEAVARSGIRVGALRLNWTRGGGGRGLDPPEAVPPDPATGRPGSGRFWLQLSACTPRFTPLRVIVSPTERRCATSLLSRIKTFAYGSAIQARRQARDAGADDALLQSSAGGLCCGTVANLLLQDEGGHWLTPPLASGCLPGVMRRRALELGLVREAPGPIGAEALRRGAVRAALLVNSLGCSPIANCDGEPLETVTEREAEAFWRALL